MSIEADLPKVDGGEVVSIADHAGYSAHELEREGAHEDAPAGAVVVVGVDGSPAALHALRQATTVVRAIGGRIVIVYARHMPIIADDLSAGAVIQVAGEAEDELEQSAEHDALAVCASAEVPATFVGCDGDPGRSLIDVAHEVNASCVVVGATIHGAISSLFLSSVAEYLLHHCDLSLVIVRPEAVEEPASE